MSKIYALCSKPKVDYLTDGKRYEVVKDFGASGFRTVTDSGFEEDFNWADIYQCKWTRIEEDETPQWALDKAARRAKLSDWADARDWSAPEMRQSIRAHAETLAKYETEPVDPVLVKARELLAAEFEGNDDSLTAENYREREYDDSAPMLAVMAALRLPAMGSGQ